MKGNKFVRRWGASDVYGQCRGMVSKIIFVPASLRVFVHVFRSIPLLFFFGNSEFLFLFINFTFKVFYEGF